MFTDEIPFPCCTGTVSITLAITDEEVNDVLIAIVAVSYPVLAKDVGRLNEEVTCLRSRGGFGKLFGADKLNHFPSLQFGDCQLH